MAGLTAVNAVGESVVALLRARRDLLAADNLLGPIPPTLDISQVPLGRLAGGTAPANGLTITCYRVAHSDYPAQRTTRQSAPGPASLALELQYLLAVWSTAAAEEQAILSWAMLELAAHPVLDRGLLLASGGFASTETVQIVPDSVADETLFRLWDVLQQKMRLSTLFRARVIRIGHAPAADWPPVVARRVEVEDMERVP